MVLLKFVLLIIGLVMLWAGAEILVRYASRLAKSLGVSPVILGLTVVSLGTSIPELVICIIATLQNDFGIAIGNIVGSNIANLGLILGIAALIVPLEAKTTYVRREVPYMIIVTLFFLFSAFTNDSVNRIEGTILFGFLIFFLMFIGRSTLKEMTEFKEIAQQSMNEDPNRISVAKKWLYFFLSMAGIGILIGGSKLAVNAGTDLAKILGVRNSVIGLTLIAIGTSLPELGTTIVSAIRKEIDLAVGNVIGSNIFNITLIGGTTALVRPISLVEESHLLSIEFPLLLGLTVLIWPMMRLRSNVQRYEGFILLSIYLVFLYFTVEG